MSSTLVPGRPAVRVGRASWVRRPRTFVVGAGLVAVAVALLVSGVLRGDVQLSLDSVLDVLTGAGSRIEQLVVVELRLPRLLVGAMVGVAFGMSGALTQTVTRNPLATPDVMGVTFGASAAVVAVIVLGSGVSDGAVAGLAAWVALPTAALVGGLATAVVVYVMSWRDGIDGLRMVLIGIAVGSFLLAITSWLLVRAQIQDVAAATLWITGSLNNRTWGHVVLITVVVAAVGIAAVLSGRTLRALSLGPDSARALGVRLQTAQLAVIGVAVLLASVATAVAGPITFVALAAPQIAARLTRVATPPVLISGLTGACLALAADLIGRTLLPAELPVGVVTAVLGAPYLIALLVQTSRRVSA